MVIYRYNYNDNERLKIPETVQCTKLLNWYKTSNNFLKAKIYFQLTKKFLKIQKNLLNQTCKEIQFIYKN
jgi:hypothetical protein